MKILPLFTGVGIAFTLRTGRSGVRIPAEARDFSLLENIHINSGDHSASYLMRTGVSFQGVKQQIRETNKLPPINADVKNEWNFNSTSPTSLNRDNFFNSGFHCLFLKESCNSVQTFAYEEVRKVVVGS
jgi:hypothetical protein